MNRLFRLSVLTAPFNSSSCRAVGRAAVLVGVATVVAGCGGTRRAPKSYPVRYARNGVRVLAAGRLPEATYEIAALRYAFRGRSYSRLGLRFASSNTQGVARGGGWSGGPSLEPDGRHRVLQINVSRSCEGASEVVLAYGLLRDSHDAVTVRSQHGIIRLKRATIPARFAAGGILVYGVLGVGPVDVITRTPDGRVVSDERYGSLGNAPCRAG